MTTAYVVFNHREPAQLTRLLTTLRLNDPDAELIVHHDRFSYANDFSLPPELRVTVLTNHEPIVWGDASQVEMSWRSMRWIRDNVAFDWLVMLSAQDYPIRPLHELNAMLSASAFDVFVEASPIDEIGSFEVRRDAQYRYLYQYIAPSRWRSMPHLRGRSHAIARRAASLAVDVANHLSPALHLYKYPDPLPTRLGLRAKVTPFSDRRPCWKGSAWATLNHHAVSTVLDFVDANPAFVRYFDKVALPDEAATNTILGNDGGLRLNRHGLHMIHWSKAENSHPQTLRVEDLESITTSPFYFARKFDIGVDDLVLDRIDDIIAGA